MSLAADSFHGQGRLALASQEDFLAASERRLEPALIASKALLLILRCFRRFPGASPRHCSSDGPALNLSNLLSLWEILAHPARFELTTSAFGGQRSDAASMG